MPLRRPTVQRTWPVDFVVVRAIRCQPLSRRISSVTTRYAGETAGARFGTAVRATIGLPLCLALAALPPLALAIAHFPPFPIWSLGR